MRRQPALASRLCVGVSTGVFSPARRNFPSDMRIQAGGATLLCRFQRVAERRRQKAIGRSCLATSVSAS